MSHREWDYIIVGAGTAGCVLAARLTERPDVRVLLLEAGSAYSRLVLGPPLPSMGRTFAHSWQYYTEPQVHLGGRRIQLPMGKVIGGSSSVNAMMYVRGAADVYDRWSDLGNRGWSYKEVLPYFVASERHERGASAYRGASGPLHVSNPRSRAPFSSAFVEACREVGMPPCDDFNVPSPEGTGFYQVTQRGGERETTGRAYLAPALARPNLRVLTHAATNRLLFDGARAVGVEYQHAGTTTSAYAGREVLLASGSLNSPTLLMHSGVGPAAHLRDRGIAVRLDLPGVGEGLQDHVRIPLLHHSSQPSPGRIANWIPGAIEYLLRRRGVMASNCCESGAITRSSPDVREPDLQFVTHFQSRHSAGTVDLEFCLIRSESRGTVRLRSRDPRVPPMIDPAYLSADSDIRVLVRGLMLGRELARTQAFARFQLGAEFLPGAQATSKEAMIAHLRATAETCYHPAGTCAMGVGPDAVVDTELRVHGLQGLRVIDASIMPVLVAGNTLASTVMIAEKGAAMIAGTDAGPTAIPS